MTKKAKSEKPAKLRPDAAETAFRVFQEAVGEAPKTDPANREKNPTAVERGSKGGNARRDTMTLNELAESARNAAKARWPAKKEKR